MDRQRTHRGSRKYWTLHQCCIMLQVVGFVVLVSGTSLYNELIRSCLPTVYESTVDSDLEVSPPVGKSVSMCASERPSSAQLIGTSRSVRCLSNSAP